MQVEKQKSEKQTFKESDVDAGGSGGGVSIDLIDPGAEPFQRVHVGGREERHQEAEVPVGGKEPAEDAKEETPVVVHRFHVFGVERLIFEHLILLCIFESLSLQLPDLLIKLVCLPVALNSLERLDNKPFLVEPLLLVTKLDDQGQQNVLAAGEVFLVDWVRAVDKLHRQVVWHHNQPDSREEAEEKLSKPSRHVVCMQNKVHLVIGFSIRVLRRNFGRQIVIGKLGEVGWNHHQKKGNEKWQLGPETLCDAF